ncbi:MAG: histidinol dehydrogenase, partial [Deltaproteobacteria bacterium]|nr:histidinol dehydrogenase [Deltaproteobacteria bacterium]
MAAARATGKAPLRVLNTTDASFDAAFEKLARRRVETDDAVEKAVKKILERVRDGGDRELLALVRKHDSPKVESLEVSRDEWDAGVAKVDPSDRAA